MEHNRRPRPFSLEQSDLLLKLLLSISKIPPSFFKSDKVGVFDFLLKKEYFLRNHIIKIMSFTSKTAVLSSNQVQDTVFKL